MSQAMELSDSDNDRIRPGGNMQAWEVVFDEIDAFYDEARNFASDGFAIKSQAQADQIDKLDKALLAKSQEADALRVAEKAPYDQLIDEIQTRYNPFIQAKKGKVDVARSTLKALLTAWRIEQQRIKDEAARKVREEAEEAERLAQQAFQQTSVADLAEREEAQRLADRAAALTKQANHATKAAATGTGLRTSWTARVSDRNAAIKHYWGKDPDAFERLVLDMAMTEVRRGVREIPGFEIQEVKGAI